MITDKAAVGGNPCESFTCPHCGKVYKSAAALKAHVKKEHPDAFDKE
ncbi:hypothetical protein OBV_18100 [Oscillibacter valericigenes Sjm18-20]|nr:hypothetical protein OBV_18100 [Oscillibacter valericigenes Sjm18-20]